MAHARTRDGASSREGRPAQVRALRPEKAGLTAAWHRDEFPRGFYVRLGPRFLTAYYRGFVKSPHASALVAVTAGGHVIGYLAGTTDDARHNRWMLSHYGLVVVAVGLACVPATPTEPVGGIPAFSRAVVPAPRTARRDPSGRWEVR